MTTESAKDFKGTLLQLVRTLGRYRLSLVTAIVFAILHLSVKNFTIGFSEYTTYHLVELPYSLKYIATSKPTNAITCTIIVLP